MCCPCPVLLHHPLVVLPHLTIWDPLHLLHPSPTFLPFQLPTCHHLHMFPFLEASPKGGGQSSTRVAGWCVITSTTWVATLFLHTCSFCCMSLCQVHLPSQPRRTRTLTKPPLMCPLRSPLQTPPRPVSSSTSSPRLTMAVDGFAFNWPFNCPHLRLLLHCTKVSSCHF